MSKILLKDYNPDFDKRQLWYWCPGCRHRHSVDPQVHKFNADFERPTFSPSLLLQYVKQSGPYTCHSYIENGEIRFLGDCTHEMAGQTVQLPGIRFTNEDKINIEPILDA